MIQHATAQADHESGTRPRCFSLVKWYVDLVTQDGIALIAYAGRLCWRQLSMTYSSVMVSTADGRQYEKHTFGRMESPQLDDDVLTWNQRALRVVGRWRRLQPPIRKQLIAGAKGEITWWCVMPCADARVRVDGHVFDGLGYAEQVSLSISPWTLPFRTLRWGRHTSEHHAIVWIDWAGDDTRRYVWFNGVEQHGSRLGENSVGDLTGGTTLSWRDARDVCRRRPVAIIAEDIPAPLHRLLTPMIALHEHKQLAPSTVESAGAPEDGWTLFEHVTW
jgi:hypothetical protein